MTRTREELRAELATWRREQRGAKLRAGKAKPQTMREIEIFHAGIVERFGLVDETDDDR